MRSQTIVSQYCERVGSNSSDSDGTSARRSIVYFLFDSAGKSKGCFLGAAHCASSLSHLTGVRMNHKGSDEKPTGKDRIEACRKAAIARWKQTGYHIGGQAGRYRLIRPLSRNRWLCECINCGNASLRIHNITLRSERKKRLTIVRTHFCHADQMDRVGRRFPLLATHVFDIRPNDRSRKECNWHYCQVKTVCPLCPDPEPRWKELKEPISPLCQNHHFLWLNYCRLRKRITWSAFIRLVQEKGENDVRKNRYKVMRPHDPKLKGKILEDLRNGRGPQHAAKVSGIPIGTIESWSRNWRRQGLLSAYVRPGMAYSLKAKLTFNGFHRSIQKAFRSMVDSDKNNGRTCAFANVLECGRFFLDKGNPRPCAYCGRKPPDGQIWGLDRLDSRMGHIPGNLVPCCGSHPDGRYLSCQASKSHFPLRAWLHANISRSLGRPATEVEVKTRMKEIKRVAESLANKQRPKTAYLCL